MGWHMRIQRGDRGLGPPPHHSIPDDVFRTDGSGGGRFFFFLLSISSEFDPNQWCIS